MVLKKALRAALRFTIECIRSVLSLFPQPLRRWLRQQHALMGLYSKALHQSRLFYGTLSPQQQQTRYIKVMKHQNSHLLEQVQQARRDQFVDCVVLNPSSQALPFDTLASLQSQQGVRYVYLINASDALNNTGTEQYNKVRLLEQATVQGDFPLLLIRANEFVNEQAIALFLSKASEWQSPDIVTCDTDFIDNDLVRYDPQCYPQWDPDLQLGSAYIETGICVFGHALKQSAIALLLKQRDASCYALWLAECYFMEPDAVITHIPYSLIHRKSRYSFNWYKILNNSSLISKERIKASPGKTMNTVNIAWPLSSFPLVSIIIPTRNAKALVDACITSILNKTHYQNFEILLVDNGSDDPQALQFFEELAAREQKVTIIPYHYPFNYSAINNFAATEAKGTVYAFVNNDIEVISPNWLDDMLQNVMRPDIGCVGAKLYYPNRRIQHAGVVLGYGGGAGHAHKYFPDYHPGYLNRLIVNNSFSAVTAACLLITKKDFDAVKGFNEQSLTVAFNDVDLCLKVLQLGKRNLYCSTAELYHHESISRGSENTPEKRNRFEAELKYLQEQWADYIADDPAYNVNLTLKQENFALRQEQELSIHIKT